MHLVVFTVCINHLKTNNMNQLEQTPEEYQSSINHLERQARQMFGMCIVLILTIAVLVIALCHVNHENKLLIGKQKTDSISIQSYKNLLLTNNQINVND